MSLLKNLIELPGQQAAVQRSYRRELVTELSLPMTFAVMEGGFVGVIADKVYEVSPWVLAIITAAPMFSNLSSFIWAKFFLGRAKVFSLVIIQSLILFFTALVAFAPTDADGIYLIIGSMICVRLLMTGQLTIRSLVWSLNYSRNVRARITGRLILVNSLTMVLVTAIGSVMMDIDAESFRWVYAGAVFFGIFGVYAFSKVIVIGEAAHLKLELENSPGEVSSSMWDILRNDKEFARYQTFQFLAGTSNMMLEAPVIYLVSNQLGASYTVSIGIAVIIPFVISMIALPVWAKVLDQNHVTHFRARQSIFWVISQLVMWLGALNASLTLLALGRIILGVARGGGALAWNIGHNDFATQKNLAGYMGAHVTLTGIRGAFAPFMGILLYLGWSDVGFLPDFSGIGASVFLIAAGLSTVSWIGYRRMDRELKMEKTK